MTDTRRYIVYKTTNNISGEFYIGVHGQIEDDSYLGSGIRLKRQISKYGRSNFSRETLFEFSTEEEAFSQEIRCLEEVLGQPECLNISSGGDGGPNFAGRTHTQSTKLLLAESSRGREISEEARMKISEANRRRWSNGYRNTFDYSKRKPPSEETKMKISESVKNLPSRKHSEETKLKISNTMKKRYEDPQIREEHSKRMKDSWTDERRESWSTTQKDKWTPEMRKKQSEKIRDARKSL